MRDEGPARSIKRKAAARLAAATLGMLPMSACADQHESFVAECRAIAGVDVRDRALWTRYVEQLRKHQGHLRDGQTMQLFPTDDFSFVSHWADSNLLTPPLADTPYDDDHRIRELATGKLVAVARNRSMRVTGGDSMLAWTCFSEAPELYQPDLQMKRPIDG